MAVSQGSTQGARGMARAAVRLLLGALALCAALARAQMDMSPLTATRTLTWSSNNVNETFSFCVESFQEAPDKKSSSPINYSMTASIGGATTPFTLATAAGQTLPVTLAWTDTVSGISYPLSPAVSTPMTLTGRLAACPGGNNGLLTLTVQSTALGAAAPGTYTRTFTLDALNAGSGRTRRSASVTMSVVIPATIRISDIADLQLGTFNGVNDLVLGDSVCIYKNSGALYSITAAGNGAGGAFTLTDGTRTVPYSVTWQDNVGTVTLVSGVPANARGNAFTANTTCNNTGSNNATFTVRVLKADLLNALQAGTYSGVLTLMVAPQ